MQLAGSERRNAIVGMHPDRGGVQNGVKGLRAQSSAGQRLRAESAGELLCGSFAAGANSDGCSGTGQRKNGCSSRTTRAEDQDAAAFDAEFFLERTEQAEAVGVAAVERPVAANDHRVNSANFRCERIALLQILENGLLVRMSDAESTKAKFGDGLQKIAKVMHKEREIDGIDATRYESRVVQERRKRMADRIANHSVDPRAARESVRAVKILHVMQRNLARSGSTGDRRVRQGTSLAQSENARGQASLSHRNGNETFGITSQAEEPDAVADGPRLSGDLHGVDSAMRRRTHASRQIRRALKVVHGKHDARRHGIFPHGLAGKLAQGFHFQIAPLASSFAGLNQPIEFTVNAPGKPASAFAAAAGGEKGGVPRLEVGQPMI